MCFGLQKVSTKVPIVIKKIADITLNKLKVPHLGYKLKKLQLFF